MKLKKPEGSIGNEADDPNFYEQNSGSVAFL
jgi:hypothetical protein